MPSAADALCGVPTCTPSAGSTWNRVVVSPLGLRMRRRRARDEPCGERHRQRLMSKFPLPGLRATPQCIRALPYATGYDDVPLTEANGRALAGIRARSTGCVITAATGQPRAGSLTRTATSMPAVSSRTFSNTIFVSLTRPRAERGDDDHLAREIDRRDRRRRNERPMNRLPGLTPRARCRARRCAPSR